MPHSSPDAGSPGFTYGSTGFVKRWFLTLSFGCTPLSVSPYTLVGLAADVIRHAGRRHEIAFVRGVDEHLAPRTCGPIPS